VIGGESGVRLGGDVLRRVSEPSLMTERAPSSEVREAAVGVDPREGAGDAVHIVARAAGRQTPQVTSGWTMTVSPTATWLTAEPTASTQPAFSWPRV